jgi:hypothetical protein
VGTAKDEDVEATEQIYDEEKGIDREQDGHHPRNEPQRPRKFAPLFLLFSILSEMLPLSSSTWVSRVMAVHHPLELL